MQLEIALVTRYPFIKYVYKIKEFHNFYIHEKKNDFAAVSKNLARNSFRK